MSLSRPQRLLLLLWLGVIFVFCFNQLKESDSFYHLKTGQVIWETKSIPTFDIFSYTAYGKTWITHEWLAELLFYFAYSAGGFYALLGFVALLGVLTFYLVFRAAIERGANFYAALVFLYLFGYLIFELWIPRPQVFSFFSFALIIYFLEKYRASKKAGCLWWSFFAIWFWANVHASFILGLVIFVFYFASEALKSKWPMFFGRTVLGRDDLRELGLAALAAIAVSFLNPNGYKSFLYSYYIKETAETLFILEWKPITFFLERLETKIFLFGIFIVNSYLIWRLWFKEKTRDITSLGVVLGISLLPFISIRHVGFWPLAALIPFAVAITPFAEKFLANIPEKFSRLPEIILGTAGLLFILARILNFSGLVNHFTVPERAVDFIQKNNIKGPLFNLLNEGGYLIWRLYPEEKVFIDGRSEVFGGEALRELFSITGAGADASRIINEKYKINYFILPYQPNLLKESIMPLIRYLAENAWPLIYWDDAAVIFVRRSLENKKIIDKYELKYVSPFREPGSIPKDEAKLAAEELKRVIDISPESQFIKNYASLFLMVHWSKGEPFPIFEPGRTIL